MYESKINYPAIIFMFICLGMGFLGGYFIFGRRNNNYVELYKQEQDRNIFLTEQNRISRERILELERINTEDRSFISELTEDNRKLQENNIQLGRELAFERERISNITSVISDIGESTTAAINSLTELEQFLLRKIKERKD